MNYNESIAYLEKLSSLGIHLGLERVELLLSNLGDPHKTFRSILVAGTNGKGSVCAMLEAVLIEAGFKVGMYTSPHIKSYTERIRIGGKDIDEKRFAGTVSLIKESIGKMDKGVGDPTLFEAITAGAFVEFSKEKVDFALLEVGLGGRLDATNVVDPEVSAVTNVDYDHTEILGKDILKIALEKAGVIKEGVPFVTAAEGGPLDLLVSVSNEAHAPVYLVRRSGVKEALPLAADYISVMESSMSSDGQEVKLKGRYGSYDLIVPLIGAHQALNLGVAIGIIEALKDKGIEIDKDSILKGLTRTKWRGRFEIVSKEPLVILDCAHNPSGAKCLKETLGSMDIDQPLTVILGMLSNKDIKTFLKTIVPMADKVIATRSTHPRAASPDIIAAEAKKFCPNVSISPGVSVALDLALRPRTAQTVCITGSLFTVSDAIKFIEKNGCVH